ncbi:MAG: DUF4191 domain-containing protein [Micrococcales bacterium]
MAKTPKAPKEPGRIKQLWDLYKLTAKTDKKSAPIAIGTFVVIAALAFVLAGLTTDGSPIGYVLYGVLGVAIAGLTGLILMSRRAEVVAYNRIEGQPGAVGAVLDNGFRAGWVTPSQPVAVNPKTKDLVYRIVGPAGVVIIGEGQGSALQVLVNEEKRKLSKVVHGVPTHVITVGVHSGQVRLSQLKKHVFKLKRELNRREIRVVDKRLSSIGFNMAIPKGIDPNRIKSAGRPR